MLYDASSSENGICTSKRERHTSKTECDTSKTERDTSATEFDKSYNALGTSKTILSPVAMQSLVQVLFEYIINVHIVR